MSEKIVQLNEDMVCCLLSNGGVATSFYQRSANHVSFFTLFSICAIYCTLSVLYTKTIILARKMWNLRAKKHSESKEMLSGYFFALFIWI